MIANMGSSDKARNSAPASDALASDALLKLSFEASPEAIALTRFRDGMLMAVNREWEQLTGYMRGDVVGRPIETLAIWPDEQARERGIQPLIEHGRLADTEVRLRMHGGALRVVRLNASLVQSDGEDYAVIYLRDITAEQLAAEAVRAGERALEETNMRLNRQVRLFELTESVASVGYWVTYPGDPLVYMSRGYATLAGFGSRTAAPLTEHMEGLLPQDKAQFEAALEALDGQMVEYRWRHPDGRVLWVRSRMHRYLEQGVLKAVMGIVQEVSAEKLALQAVGDQLAFIQKLTSRAPGMLFEFQTWGTSRMAFHFVSAGSKDLLGVNPDELRGDINHLFRRVDRSEFPRLIHEAMTALRLGTTWQTEFLTRAIEGHASRWLLINAVPEVQKDKSVLWCGAITDINTQKEALERLQDSEARFRSLTELSSDWYWEQDENFRFVRVDGNLDTSKAFPAPSYIGNTRWESGAQGVAPEVWAAHRKQLEAHEVFHDFEVQRLRSDGSLMWVALHGAPIIDGRGNFKGYRGTGRDITARKQTEADVERLAFYDALTGLPNRRLLIDRLNQAMEFSARHITHGALLFIDLDNFKNLNDTMGHAQGDELLKQVADRLRKCVRSLDTVARLGGDEFVVMLEDIGEMQMDAATQAESIGKKVLNTLNEEYKLGDFRYHSSPSIGVTLFFQHLHTLDELLKRADLAMYQAKAAGRNTFRFFDPQMQAAAAARATMESDLRDALQQEQFVLYYQTVVDANSRASGVEALVRWLHPTRGMVSPADFIPVAEQCGLIIALGQWVLEQACAQLMAWGTDPATAGLTIAVNVSARQFRHPDFCDQTLELLRTSGANPNRLKLELTESLLLTDIEDAVEKMGTLRATGVGFALDDFGTGYSSLSYLKRLPLDQLKIDQSFVRDVLIDPNDAAIARTILTLAKSLDLGVVAEGVETEGQRAFLLESGCKSFQGYLFSRPVPLDQLVL
jgi:diguanylate cyclase (GGDEF)-like protein/PAS domain S-box-containing protein